jgi:hypothetical protein
LPVNFLMDGQGVESNQYEVALAIGVCGEPYMAWMDDANGMREVHCSTILPTGLPVDMRDGLSADPL